MSCGKFCSAEMENSLDDPPASHGGPEYTRRGTDERERAPGSLDARRIAEEDRFHSLYLQLCESLKRDKRVTDEEVDKALDDIAKSFYYDQGASFDDVDYTRYANVCGYLRRDGAFGAGMARCRVLEAARNCRALRRICLDETRGEPLRVVCLGGGPGNDALGFCSALEELGFPADRRLSVTVVDPIRQWRDCVLLATNLFRRNQVAMRFVQGRLPAYCGPCFHAVRKADVILMQRMFSSMRLGNIRSVTRNVLSAMKDTAVVVLVNACLGEREGKLLLNGENEDLFGGFEPLYLSPERDPYQMIGNHARSAPTSSKARVAVLKKTRAPARKRQLFTYPRPLLAKRMKSDDS